MPGFDQFPRIFKSRFAPNTPPRVAACVWLIGALPFSMLAAGVVVVADKLWIWLGLLVTCFVAFCLMQLTICCVELGNFRFDPTLDRNVISFTLGAFTCLTWAAGSFAVAITSMTIVLTSAILGVATGDVPHKLAYGAAIAMIIADTFAAVSVWKAVRERPLT